MSDVICVVVTEHPGLLEPLVYLELTVNPALLEMTVQPGLRELVEPTVLKAWMAGAALPELRELPVLPARPALTELKALRAAPGTISPRTEQLSHRKSLRTISPLT